MCNLGVYSRDALRLGWVGVRGTRLDEGGCVSDFLTSSAVLLGLNLCAIVKVMILSGGRADRRDPQANRHVTVTRFAGLNVAHLSASSISSKSPGGKLVRGTSSFASEQQIISRFQRNSNLTHQWNQNGSAHDFQGRYIDHFQMK